MLDINATPEELAEFENDLRLQQIERKRIFDGFEKHFKHLESQRAYGYVKSGEKNLGKPL